MVNGDVFQLLKLLITGQLFVWDINETEEPLILSSSTTKDSHYESIAKIGWTPDSTKKNSKVFHSKYKFLILIQIVTVGSDGKILVWNVNQKLDLSWKLDLIHG
jgi:WD40 repeat protein